MSGAPASVDFDGLRARLDAAEAKARDDREERREEILRRRAAAVAAPRQEKRREGDLRLVAFRVGGERYALPLDDVQSVATANALAPLLGAPRHLLGAVVARSHVVPVVDLRVLLALPGSALSDLTSVLVAGPPGAQLGIAAELVEGLVAVERATLAAAPPGPLAAAAPGALAILDVKALAKAAGRAASSAG